MGGATGPTGTGTSITDGVAGYGVRVTGGGAGIKGRGERYETAGLSTGVADLPSSGSGDWTLGSAPGANGVGDRKGFACLCGVHDCTRIFGVRLAPLLPPTSDALPDLTEFDGAGDWTRSEGGLPHSLASISSLSDTGAILLSVLSRTVSSTGDRSPRVSGVGCRTKLPD